MIAARLRIDLPSAKRQVHQVLAKLAANRRLGVAAFSRPGAASFPHGSFERDQFSFV